MDARLAEHVAVAPVAETVGSEFQDPGADRGNREGGRGDDDARGGRRGEEAAQWSGSRREYG